MLGGTFLVEGKYLGSTISQGVLITCYTGTIKLLSL